MAINTYDFVEEEKAASPPPTTPDQLEATLKNRSKYPEPHFVFLTSNIDPERRIPWCPDVVRSLPAARRQVKKAGGTLFQVNVGDRPTWKDPDHPLRHSLQATGVPTIIHWTKDGPGQRLGKDLEQLGRNQPNGEQQVEDKLAEFIASVKSEA
ncbi:hypothetical protein WJX73_005441 [Symbiochloris irregularis]|uniref:Thioredoxin domain-containing protein n=1 Tax=Symbiochloris irregularis TaxID=706552 RepID=A0AAW1P519_9CHLO